MNISETSIRSKEHMNETMIRLNPSNSEQMHQNDSAL